MEVSQCGIIRRVYPRKARMGEKVGDGKMLNQYFQSRQGKDWLWTKGSE